jgi:hypothetical protein
LSWFEYNSGVVELVATSLSQKLTLLLISVQYAPVCKRLLILAARNMIAAHEGNNKVTLRQSAAKAEWGANQDI